MFGIGSFIVRQVGERRVLHRARIRLVVEKRLIRRFRVRIKQLLKRIVCV